MNVQIILGNPRTPRREREELIQRLINDEKPRVNETRRNIDMIPNFSIDAWGW